MAKFGSARSDEHGNARGGKSGDQTGREVMVQDAYMHRNGWKIIRAKDVNVANCLAFCMAVACATNSVGYDQNERYSLFFTGIKENLPTECDCSTLVAACVCLAGITDFQVDGFYTGNEIERLVGTGAFDVFPCNSIDDMCTGDILVDAKGTSHTGIITEGKPRVQNPFDDPQPTLRRGSKGQEVVKLQLFFNWLCNQHIKVDGDFGSETEQTLKDFQAFWGLQVDGIYGNESRKVVDLVIWCNGFTPA